MSKKALKVLLVGVGGQGVLAAAKILGDAATQSGHPVLMGQLHGMSQRGGSVESQVLIGDTENVFITDNADVVVGFEPLETLRALPKISKNTTVLTSTHQIPPFLITQQGLDYPPFENILETLTTQAKNVVVIDTETASKELADPRTLNMLMLSALLSLKVLPFGTEALDKAIQQKMPEATWANNQHACTLGAALVQKNFGAPHG